MRSFHVIPPREAKVPELPVAHFSQAFAEPGFLAPLVAVLEVEVNGIAGDGFDKGPLAMEGAFEDVSRDPGRVAVYDLEAAQRIDLTSGTSPTFAPTGHLIFWRDNSLWAVRFDPE